MLRLLIVSILLVALHTGAVHAQTEVVVTDDITSDVTWTGSNTYILDGLIFVHEGATLTIEPGTLVQGRRQSEISNSDGASALIVRRGARILADGTRTEPIVFTSTADDPADPSDLFATDRGLWGGIVLLGRATNNQPGGEDQIEGVPESEDALYGGTDDDDDSGILRYVSIRHGGFSISGVGGDEINGLTFGSVGRGTTIEYVEVYANFDDCFEWFGGTVRAKYLVGAFCGDDSFDYDQGWRGAGQFWFSIHAPDAAGRGGEHDGGDAGGDAAEPLSNPTISNVTYIGAGTDAAPGSDDAGVPALAIRDAAAGKYLNSIFAYFPGSGVSVEDLDGAAVDSRSRLEAGDLLLENNLWWGFAGGDALTDVAPQVFVSEHLAAGGNAVSDPMLAGIARTELSEGLDPRPRVGSLALAGATGFDEMLSDAFFTSVEFRGAFGASLWVDEWTALSDNGFLGQISNVAAERLNESGPTHFALAQNYPNPFNPRTMIDFQLEQTQRVRLAIHDVTGREVALLAEGVHPAGTFRVELDASNLPSGVYVYRLQTESGSTSRKMTLLR